MNGTVAVIPLDDRAVNYECIALLGQAAGLQVLLPPKLWLGTPWRAGQTEALVDWLEQAAAEADALVVAIDTLGYGGLVNSRRSGDTLETVMERLDILRRLKQKRPTLSILAFNVLMRINRGNDAEEEKPYWATYGADLFRLSVLEDRAAMAVADAGDTEALAALHARIPTEILNDYLGGRARNHGVNRQMLDWAAAGIFDYLIIPQDDTVDYGWNIAEARRLRQLVGRLKLTERVSIYPGTDETGMLLLARYAAQQAGFKPRVWLRYSGSGAEQVVTAYEDRPMTEMVKAHLGPLGGVITADAASADLLLYINAPAEGQGDGSEQYVLGLTEEQINTLPEPTRAGILAYRRQPHVATTLREMYTVRRDLPEFVRSLALELQADRPCAVVDVAFVNGGDVALGDLLAGLPHLSRLAAYGGWNTAGNTLGCVLAQAVIRCVQLRTGASADALAAHIRFLFLRLVEDYLYMGSVRTQIMVEELPALGLAPTLGSLGDAVSAVEELVKVRLGACAQTLAQDRFVGESVGAGSTSITVGGIDLPAISLPWGRLFDLTMDVDLHMKGEG